MGLETLPHPWIPQACPSPISQKSTHLHNPMLINSTLSLQDRAWPRTLCSLGSGFYQYRVTLPTHTENQRRRQAEPQHPSPSAPDCRWGVTSRLTLLFPRFLCCILNCESNGPFLPSGSRLWQTYCAINRKRNTDPRVHKSHRANVEHPALPFHTQPSPAPEHTQGRP